MGRGRHLRVVGCRIDSSVCERFLVLVGGIGVGVGGVGGVLVGFGFVVLSPDQLGRAGCNGINSLHGGWVVG